MQKRLTAGAMVLGLLFPFFAPHAVLGAWVSITPWPPQQRQINVGDADVIGSLQLGILPDDGESVTISSVDITGPDADDFAIVSEPCTGVRSTCRVEIEFAPSRLGVERAVVEFHTESTTRGSEVFTAPIDGIGGPIGAICGFGSFPKAASYWDTYVGQTQTLGEFERPRVANCGAADLHVTDVTIGGDDAEDFRLGSNDCVGTYPVTSEPWWQSCFIDVTFEPRSPGQKSATLTVTSDGLEAPQVFNLSGRARPHADLSITMTATTDPDPAERGGLVTYEITMTNEGPNTAKDSYVGWWFSFPGTFESVQPEGTCGPFYWGGPGGSCVHWLGDLEVGESVVVLATVRIGDSGIPGNPSASANSGSLGTADLGYDNNLATAEFSVEDLEAPTIRFENDARTYTLTEYVYIPCFAEDNAGIDWSRTSCPWTEAPAYELNLGENSVSATAFDLAGYRTDASTTFRVEADYWSVRRLTEQWVTKPSVARELLSLLSTAERAEARGNLKAEAGALADYRSLVKAQSGKAIDARNAAILVRVSFGL